MGVPPSNNDGMDMSMSKIRQKEQEWFSYSKIGFTNANCFNNFDVLINFVTKMS